MLQWVVLGLMTSKAIFLIVFYSMYDIQLFISTFVDVVFTTLTFIYALCKIWKISRNFDIGINTCYLLMHFGCVFLLVINLAWDYIFFLIANKFWGKQWTDFNYCERI